LRPIVKICGLMRVEDVRICVQHGTDIIGFVVDYPRPVPWDISAQSAKSLTATVSKPAETCIVTGGNADKVLRLAMEIKPDYLQLHCNETLEDTAYISGKLAKYRIKVIKTLFPDTPDLEETAKKFSMAGVYALLLDPRSPDNAVGGGAADLSMYSSIQRAVGCPVILAGGITAENVMDVVFRSKAPIIDLMTGVESSPGVKDEAKVMALFRALESGDFNRML